MLSTITWLSFCLNISPGRVLTTVFYSKWWMIMSVNVAPFKRDVFFAYRSVGPHNPDSVLPLYPWFRAENWWKAICAHFKQVMYALQEMKRTTACAAAKACFLFLFFPSFFLFFSLQNPPSVFVLSATRPFNHGRWTLFNPCATGIQGSIPKSRGNNTHLHLTLQILIGI